jgi:predicted Zn-ribbon and HTH transcriptional regulator
MIKPAKCFECGTIMDVVTPTVRVCPACKLLQFEDEGKIETRYPRPVKVRAAEN